MPRTNVSTPKKKENCNARNPANEHYLDMVQKVAIRGDDTRKMEKSNSTLPLWCVDAEGPLVVGSVNLVGDKKTAITALHVIQKTKTCKLKAQLTDCWIPDPKSSKKKSKILSTEPELSTSSCSDKIIKLNLDKEVEHGAPYNLPQNSDLTGKEMKVIGASAVDKDIFKNGTVIVGDGTIVKTFFKEGHDSLGYTADTKDGSSGGAIVLADDPTTIVGIHRGDIKKAQDGSGVDCQQNTNCGIGFVVKP